MFGFIIVSIIVLVVAYLEGAIFSLPVRIPFIKRLAIHSRLVRWSLILVLAALPTVFNVTGIIWSGTYSDMDEATADINPCTDVTIACNPEEVAFVRTFNLDYQLRDELAWEITLREAINNRCYSSSAEICAAADQWMIRETIQQNDGEHTSMLGAIIIFMLMLSPSFVTGYAVSQITRDQRKPRH